ANAVYDKNDDVYRILIGAFDDRASAMAMIERLRRTGYTAARIAPVSADTRSSAPAASRIAARREAEPVTVRSTQVVALEGDRILAANEDRLVLPAGNTGEPATAAAPAPMSNGTNESARKDGRRETAGRDAAKHNGDYLDTQRRDAEKLWGVPDGTVSANSKPGVEVFTDSDRAVPLGGTSTARGAATLRVGGRDYRGEIQLIRNSRGRIDVVNAVP